MGIRTTIAVLCLWGAFVVTPGLGKIIYVDVDAPGSNNGTSWNNAFKNLQDALAQAGAGDEIWVAQGVYRPDKGSSQVGGDRQATFQLKNGVRIYGGYAGYGQPKPNSRDVQAYPSILSGDLKGNDGPIDPSPTAVMRDLLADAGRQDNAYVVVTGTDADATALLSGFTITGGVANAPQWPVFYPGRGAGLFLQKGSPSIEACTFRDNLAVDGGAAVACHQASPSLSNCTFTGNRSQRNGGAISAWASSPVVSHCLFSGNRSDDNRQEEGRSYLSGFGGAIYSFDGHLVVTASTFDGNGGCVSGGAICNDHSSNADIADCRFIANVVSSRGAAVENVNGATMTLTRCVFLQNYASVEGAAVQSSDATVALVQCRFHGNTSDQRGGAVCSTRSEATIINSVFTGNAAFDLGGAVALDASDAAVINCTFTANRAAEGRAIGCDSTNPPASQSGYTVYNSILWDGGSELVSKDGSSGVLIYTDIVDEFGGWTAWANEHNTSVDPLFVDADGPDGVVGTEDDNVRLAVGSPCIDSGDNGRVPSGTVVDLDGRNRFVDDPDTADTGTGQPPIVDRGAYEYAKRVPGAAKPVANAGPDQTVFAWLDNLARVTLDGSASTDPDTDDLPYLTYKWTWKVGSTNNQAEGVNPTIQLPVGTTTVTLVVNDGRQNSNPDTVVITVLGPFTAKTSVQPEEIQRNDPRIEYVNVLMLLSEIAVTDIDNSQALILTPGQIPAVAQSAFDYREGQTFMTTIMALFDKEALMQAIPANGGVTLTVTGKLTSGRSFSGSAPVTIVGTITPVLEAPVPNPMEWALANPDVNDPNDPNHWPGEPRAVLLDPRTDGGTGETGWAIAMRAALATHATGGIEYQFDCFEDDKLDRTWSAAPNYVTGMMKRTDVVKYTFRCRARNKTGGMTAWSKWAWVQEIPVP